jgi:hypothetical protein
MGFIEGTKSRPLESDGAPSNGVDEQQTINQVAGDASGGTFTLSFEGFKTTPIAHNADAATVQAALEALPSIGAGNVSCSGGPFPAASVIATFQGNLAKKNVQLIVGDGALLTGGSAPYVVSVAETVAGVDAFRRGSGPGALAIDVTNGVHYINTGTVLEPTWTVTGTQV